MPENNQKQALILLYQHSLRSIPFNIILASILLLDLLYSGSSRLLIGIWYALLVVCSIFRWFYSKIKLTQALPLSSVQKEIYTFMLFTALTGFIWGGCYFIFQANHMQELIIILVLGGMAAGALASLSVYLPAYYAYILPMFLPLIIYNFFLLDLDRTIMASMFCLFILMLIVSAKLNYGLMLQNFKLEKEKDWLIKKLSVTNSDLEDSNEKLLHSIEEVRTISITDALTGLYNRRHFNATLHHELERAKRNQHKLNLVLIDIDNFKYVNDTFGHPYGDEFLINIANCLKNCLRRSNDTLFRIGGDEFAAILTHISLEEATYICNEVQQQFKKDIEQDKVSLSIGIISIAPNYGTDIKHIIARADEALYEAKRKGKNQVAFICLNE